jgi:hypothetical protein
VGMISAAIYDVISFVPFLFHFSRLTPRACLARPVRFWVNPVSSEKKKKVNPWPLEGAIGHELFAVSGCSFGVLE